jgi:hypothetical protein
MGDDCVDDRRDLETPTVDRIGSSSLLHLGIDSHRTAGADHLAELEMSFFSRKIEKNN